MIPFVIALALLTGCSDLPDKLTHHAASADEDGGADDAVRSSSQALTGPVNYTYVNSNNGGALGSDDRWLAGLRCLAMSQHAGNGHNFWSCAHSTTTSVYCFHSPSLPTSGATSLYIDQCTNSSPWSCKIHISNNGVCACETPIVGTMSWSPSAPMGEIRSYAFNDGTVGSCSAEVGNGLFQEWSP